MSKARMTDTLSDDGELRIKQKQKDVIDTITLDERRRNVENDLGISIRAQLSVKGHFGQRAEEEIGSDAIFEHPDESDGRSGRSPPGTVGQMHEVSSEYVGAKHYKFLKNAGNLMHDHNDSEDDTSKEAIKSNYTKLTEKALVSEVVEIDEKLTSRSIQTFAMNYDRIYREFQEQLIAEYAAARSSYVGDYQENFNQNTSRSQDKVAEMNQAIGSLDGAIRELGKADQAQASCLNRFFTMK